MGWQELAGVAAAVCLTIYPALAVGRMVQRKSSLDYSVPGLALVVVGLSLYLVAVWGSAGQLAGTISLAWNIVMLWTAGYYRVRSAKPRRAARG